MATLYEVREQANAALASGDHTRAFSLALLMQRHFPKDYQTLELLGKLYLEDRRLREARETFGRVLEIDPENVLARAALAMIAEEEGDLDEALDQFERAFDVDPGNHEIATEIARLHSQLNHNKPPEPGSSMHSMARRFLVENKYESAIPWLQEALRIAPDLTDVAVGLVRALWLAWRPVEAEEVAREILAEHPDCLRALAVAAGAASAHGDEEALPLLARASELNPGNEVAERLFAEAGLVFPEREEKLDIPDDELQEAINSPAGMPSDGELAETPMANPTVSEAEVVEPSDIATEEAGEATPGGEEAAQQPADEMHELAPQPAGEMHEPPRAEEPEPAEPPGAASEAAEPEAPNPLLARLAALREMPAGDEPVAGSLAVRSEPGENPSHARQLESGPVTWTEIGGPTGKRDGAREEKAGVAEAEAVEQASAHISAAGRYAASGEVELALAEYRAALKLDPSVAQAVGDAVFALLDADPGNLLAHWLAGDAMAMDGQFRRAVEQYLVVLKGATETRSPDPNSIHGQD